MIRKSFRVEIRPWLRQQVIDFEYLRKRKQCPSSGIRGRIMLEPAVFNTLVLNLGQSGVKCHTLLTQSTSDTETPQIHSDGFGVIVPCQVLGYSLWHTTQPSG